MDIAVPHSTGNQRALEVEECACPQGYRGPSCQVHKVHFNQSRWFCRINHCIFFFSTAVVETYSNWLLHKTKIPLCCVLCWPWVFCLGFTGVWRRLHADRLWSLPGHLWEVRLQRVRQRLWPGDRQVSCRSYVLLPSLIIFHCWLLSSLCRNAIRVSCQSSTRENKLCVLCINLWVNLTALCVCVCLSVW